MIREEDIIERSFCFTDHGGEFQVRNRLGKPRWPHYLLIKATPDQILELRDVLNRMLNYASRTQDKRPFMISLFGELEEVIDEEKWETVPFECAPGSDEVDLPT